MGFSPFYVISFSTESSWFGLKMYFPFIIFVFKQKIPEPVDFILYLLAKKWIHVQWTGNGRKIFYSGDRMNSVSEFLNHIGAHHMLLMAMPSEQLSVPLSNAIRRIEKAVATLRTILPKQPKKIDKAWNIDWCIILFEGWKRVLKILTTSSGGMSPS